ncbi:MAG: multicopper oxidase domain-containing protein [Lewinellaceae bacterium]|nr:multicopper oxidase domain-containing protein [Lewinellaceae bacterium]
MHKILFFIQLVLFISYTGIAQNPLLIPPILSGENIDLTLQQGSVEFYPGTSTATMGVNGNILGPTLMLEKGQEVSITVNNLIGESTTIHWHGMHVSAANDGGPHTVIAAEETWNPQFTVMDNAATYWYHPHLHEKTNDHVLQGIAGFIIVQDEEEATLDLPRTYGIDDFPIVIQTKTFDADKQIVLGANAMDTTVLVNATRNPFVNVPAQVVRLRLLNGASQRIFNLGLSNNLTFFQIASDGGLLSQPIELTRLPLAPGERAEILIDLASNEGQSIFLKSYASELPTGFYGALQVGMNAQMTIPGYSSNPLNGADFNILQINVDEPSGGVTTIPTHLTMLTPWDQNDVDTTRNLLFTPEAFGPSGMVNGPFVIDGNSFDLNVINQVIPLDNVEIWEITNQTMIAHPFHIHDVQFYLLTRNGVPVPENEQGRKDVVLIPPQFGSIRFITKFEDFADDEVPYMYHCHMLTHEDEGMMGQFTVVDYSTGIHEFEGESISLYPNPTTQSVTLKGLKPSVIELFNTSGQLLEQRETSKNLESFGLSNYSSGVYYLKVKDMDMNRTFKVIKN